MVTAVDITATEFAGAQKFRHADVTVTYETGGVSFTPSALNMNRFQNVILTLADDTEAVVVSFDPAAQNLLMYDAADGSELAADTEVDLLVTGIGR
jgi:hypothetical protein